MIPSVAVVAAVPSLWRVRSGRDRRVRAIVAILCASLVVGACSAAGATPAPSGGTAPGSGCPTVPPDPLPAGETRTVTIETELGDIVMDVAADLGPRAAGNFVELVECGFYDGVVFHRIIPGFVIQGGDPTGRGSGGPGYEFPNDPVAVPYERGVVAMANAGRDTNGSQFFIILGPTGLPPDYSVFARVTSGMEVADEIAAGPSTGGQQSLALEPVAMTVVRVTSP